MDLFSAIVLPHFGTLMWIFIIAIMQREYIYRFVFLPRRKPDYKCRLYEYWFDEMICYAPLVRKTSKKRLYEIKGKLYRMQTKHIDRGEEPVYGVGWWEGSMPVEPQVQQAYDKHLETKFEEIVLGSTQS